MIQPKILLLGQLANGYLKNAEKAWLFELFTKLWTFKATFTGYPAPACLERNFCQCNLAIKFKHGFIGHQFVIEILIESCSSFSWHHLELGVQLTFTSKSRGRSRSSLAITRQNKPFDLLAQEYKGLAHFKRYEKYVLRKWFHAPYFFRHHWWWCYVLQLYKCLCVTIRVMCSIGGLTSRQLLLCFGFLWRFEC